MPYYCYIIHNGQDRTYNGYTTDPRRRLRQHNGELVGGAKATRGRGPWRFLAVLTSPEWDCVSTAMKHEWSIKYPTRRRPRPKLYEGGAGRVESLSKVFQHMEATGCAAQTELRVAAEYFELASRVCLEFPFVRISLLNF